MTDSTMYFDPPVEGTWAFDIWAVEAYFTPEGGIWPLNQTFTLYVEGYDGGVPDETAVRDASGIAMEETYTSSFRTGRVLVVTPNDGDITNQALVSIEGFGDSSVVSIEADGVWGIISGGLFTIAGYPLSEGGNVIKEGAVPTFSIYRGWSVG